MCGRGGMGECEGRGRGRGNRDGVVGSATKFGRPRSPSRGFVRGLKLREGWLLMVRVS